jgi:hypothetical protein
VTVSVLVVGVVEAVAVGVVDAVDVVAADVVVCSRVDVDAFPSVAVSPVEPLRGARSAVVPVLV